jgi:hypothetical protein
VKAALLLVAGAAVNVAVAWGCCIYEHIPIQRVLKTRVNPVPFGTYHPDMTLGDPTSRTAIRIDMRLPIRAGWPGSACEAFMFERKEGRLVRTSGPWQAGIQVPARVLGLTGDDIPLPLRPIWPGFAINMVFYAAILGALFALPGARRRRRRVKRGLCPACAYPVGESAVCTECGKPVETRLGGNP